MRVSVRAFALVFALISTSVIADDAPVYLSGNPAKPTKAPSLLRQWTKPPPARGTLGGPADLVSQLPVPAANSAPTPGSQSSLSELPAQRLLPQPTAPATVGTAVPSPVSGSSPSPIYGPPAGSPNVITPAYATPPGTNESPVANPYGSPYGYQGTYTPVTEPVASPYQTLDSAAATVLPAPSAADGMTPNVAPSVVAPPVPPHSYVPQSPVPTAADNLWGGHLGHATSPVYDDSPVYDPMPVYNATPGYATPGYATPGYDSATAYAMGSRGYSPSATPGYVVGDVAAPPCNPVTLPVAVAPVGCAGICDPCRPRGWMRADFLFGWLSGYDTPPLLTRNPVGTGIGDIGDLTYPDTRVVFGGNDIGDDVRIGGRISGGYWFGNDRRWGVQAEGFAIGNDDEDIRIFSAGDPILSRPFFNTSPDFLANDAQVLSLGGVADGQFIASSTGRLISVAPALRFNLCCRGGSCDSGCGSPGACCGSGSPWSGRGSTASRVDLIAGYRYLQLSEGFATREVLSPTSQGFTSGTAITLRDAIDTQNDFHAFEIGTNMQLQNGRWLWDLRWSTAIGELTRHYTRSGSTNFSAPAGVNETFDGGFLVPPENIGSYESTQFTVMPQARIGLGYCLSNNIRLHVDYSVLYLDRVFRPGALMATEFDGRNLGAAPAAGVVGSAAPVTDDEDVVFHGLSIGLSCNY